MFLFSLRWREKGRKKREDGQHAFLQPSLLQVTRISHGSRHTSPDAQAFPRFSSYDPLSASPGTVRAVRLTIGPAEITNWAGAQIQD